LKLLGPMSKLIYLKEILAEKGIKQSFIAEKLGVSNATVSLWVKNKSHPSISNLKRLALLLDVDTSLLLHGKEGWD
jgi:transcriptional regulator with XRE-family HTH domain